MSSLNSIARGQNEVNVESHLVALTPDLFYTGGKKTIVLCAVQKGKKLCRGAAITCRVTA